MSRLAAIWAQRFLSLLDRLASQPFTLLCVLLAANALVRPYFGLVHDARLYGAQVTEHVHPGTLSDDLYLEYGSQDRYSIFTTIMAPLVAVLGLHASFFLGYLASKALFFWGAIRLVGAVVRERAVAAIALLCVAIIPVSFGGNEVFHVNEPFLTPRLSACALVFFGLERMLASKLWAALALLGAAFLLHPLMAVAGVLVFVLWLLAGCLTKWQMVSLLGAGAVTAGVVLLYDPLGTTLFGHMDDTWRDVNFRACYFIKPALWTWADWGRVGWSMLVVAVAAKGFARSSARFLGAVVGVGVLGLIGSLAAVHSNYLLLIQGSPYRALWLVELLAIPLAFGWAFELWRRGTPLGSLAAPVIVLLATSDWNENLESSLALLLGCMLPCVCLYRGLKLAPERADWLRCSAGLAVVAVVVLMLVADFRMLFLLTRMEPTVELDPHPVMVLLGAGHALYKLPILVFLVSLMGLFFACTGPRLHFRAALIALWAGYQLALTGIGESDWYGSRYTMAYSGRHFVTSFLHEKADAHRRPLTVYWTTDLDALWFEAKVNSYFHFAQLSGCAFNRDTAIEGDRRAEALRRFEMERVKRSPLTDSLIRRYYGEEDTPSPARGDILRLCGEKNLDYLIVEIGIDGLYAATDGRYYIYDCAHLRSLPHQAADSSIARR